jgi:hypothetical protein
LVSTTKWNLYLQKKKQSEIQLNINNEILLANVQTNQAKKWSVVLVGSNFPISQYPAI